MNFLTSAGQSILQDQFGQCFQPLPRRSYPLCSMLWPFWIISIFIRYFLLFPLRLWLFLASSGLALLVLVPLAMVSPPRSPLVEILLHVYMKMVLLSLGTMVRYYGKKPDVSEPHIFVANHTSVTDFVVSSGKGRVHAVVAQAHGGVFGWMSRTVLKPLTNSILFDRNESRDRALITKRMKEHVNSLDANPLLIFPEGTCVNNEFTVLFHKGAFELDCAVCPVAIKYDKRFGDPYFNTREQSFMQHLMYLMTRWINPVSVHWIKPQRRVDGESSVEFTNRVKAIISDTAGLKNLSWDGYMKNFRPSKEKQEKMRSLTSKEYTGELKRRLLTESCPLLPEKDYIDDDKEVEEVEEVEDNLCK